MNENLEWLTNRAKIQDLITSYALGVDMCDWKLFGSIFTDTIDRDVSSVTGSPAETIPKEQQVEECKAGMPGFDSSKHTMSNMHITIDENTAKAIVYMVAEHFLTTDEEQQAFVINGFYTYKFVLDGTDWKISGVKLDVLSARGHELMQTAAAKTAGMSDEQRNTPRPHSPL